jgi:hypothetical protein
MLLVVLVSLLLLTVGAGAGGHSRYGHACWLPTAVVALMLIALWLTGTPHARGYPLHEDAASTDPFA